MKKFLKENLLFFLIIIVIVGLFNFKLPYYINAPGGTIDISNRIDYDEKKDYDGSLNMLYVTEYVATIPTYLMSFALPNWDLEALEVSQVSNETVEEIDIRNKIMLNNSINNAKYVAYNAAKKNITIKGYTHYVIGTIFDTNLKIGDEILKINDIKINNLNELKEIINDGNIGDKLKFKIIRNNKEMEVEEIIKEKDDKKIIGVIFVTDYKYELDPEIELKFKKSESGSSGGLMMSLSIYSAISGEDLLKGRNIAGTGTIDINGNVGEIAGIKYKIMGANKNNMDIVLVPSANYDEAVKTKNKYNYDLEIVKVDTFMDAIEYLRN